MSLFLITFFGVYGGMHAYAVWKVRQAWPESRLALALAIVWSLAMVFGPIFSRLLDRAGMHTLQHLVTAVTYTWCVLIFWILMSGLALDAWNGAMRLSAHWHPGARGLLVAPRMQLGIILVLLCVGSVWGLIEGRMIRATHFTVSTPRLAPGSSPIRIALLSDVHVDWYVRGRMLERIVSVTRDAQPDLVVSTGDLIDVSSHQVAREAAMLAGLEAPLGKFAVTGNHEFYLSIRDSTAFHEASGFRLLRGKSVDVADGRLRLVGVDDPAGRHVGVPVFLDAGDYLPEADAERPFTVLLQHQPRVDEKTVGRFDLQLSGHTHGGQVFPFYFFVRMVYRYGPGLHDLGRGSRLIVTRGAGLWGSPMRVLAPPEVVIIDVTPTS